jgi:hypothetical protein
VFLFQFSHRLFRAGLILATGPTGLGPICGSLIVGPMRTQDSCSGLLSATVPTGVNLERQPDRHCRDPLLLLWRLLLGRLLLLWILCRSLLLRAHSLQLLE